MEGSARLARVDRAMLGTVASKHRSRIAPVRLATDYRLHPGYIPARLVTPRSVL